MKRNSKQLASTRVENALLAEASLAKDWLSVDEDAAWKHLSALPDLDSHRKARRKSSTRRMTKDK
jgi:hypothetical protein